MVSNLYIAPQKPRCSNRPLPTKTTSPKPHLQSRTPSLTPYTIQYDLNLATIRRSHDMHSPQISPKHQQYIHAANEPDLPPYRAIHLARRCGTILLHVSRGIAASPALPPLPRKPAPASRAIGTVLCGRRRAENQRVAEEREARGFQSAGVKWSEGGGKRRGLFRVGGQRGRMGRQTAQLSGTAGAAGETRRPWYASGYVSVLFGQRELWCGCWRRCERGLYRINGRTWGVSVSGYQDATPADRQTGQQQKQRDGLTHSRQICLATWVTSAYCVHGGVSDAVPRRNKGERYWSVDAGTKDANIGR